MESREFRLNSQRIILTEDLDALSHAAATQIMHYAQKAIQDHGAFYLALSGGSTPVHLHQVLASPAFQRQLDWHSVYIYFGDERNVPHDHPDSNYRMAQETLLAKVPIPRSQIHAIPTGFAEMRDCATAYAGLLAELPQRAGMPCFDLILLGMGNDGHTASLFPETTALEELDKPVTAVFVPKLNTWRISLTYPVLAQARTIMVLVSGEAKADVLYEVFTNPERHYPIQGIHNAHTEWYVDKAAAARLIESDVGISW